MDNLKDGYYISIYSCVNKYLNNYESCLRHDHNMSLWEKTGEQLELVHHWEFERTTGYKHHDISFYDKEGAIEFINMLLSEYHLCIDDIIDIFGTPILSNENKYYDQDLGSEYTYHALSHLFSALMMDTDIFYHEDILALAVDGGADFLIDNKNFDTRCDYIGAFSSKGKIQFFHISSPGPYWGGLAGKTKLEEGTLMALATAAKCITLEKIYDKDDLLEIYRTLQESPMQLINQILERVYSYTQNDIGDKYDFFDDRFTEEENKISMAAKIIQDISVKQIDHTIDQAIMKFKLYPSKVNISLSGGYALNCPTNTHIMHKYGFKKQLIVPAANDGGQAIGMGLYYFYKYCNKIHFKLEHAYYGDKDDDIGVLQKEQYKKYIVSIENTLDHFINDISADPIIWFDGRAEIGPRALGHRSILAAATQERSKDLLNLYKKRQWWRPVAPLILKEELENWFNDSFESPYMLNNFVLKDEKKDIVPAIVHLDQTARVQTLDRNMNEKLFLCMKRYFYSTKVPIICNTSLNDKGEPIINTIEEALNFALRKSIKIMYINGHRVVLSNHSEFSEYTPKPRKHEYFSSYANRIEKKLTKAEYDIYFSISELHKYCLDNNDDIILLKRIIKKMSKSFEIFNHSV